MKKVKFIMFYIYTGEFKSSVFKLFKFKIKDLLLTYF